MLLVLLGYTNEMMQLARRFDNHITQNRKTDTSYGKQT